MSLQGPQPTVPRPIFLRLIGRCTAEQQEALRLLRNHPAIRGAMYTDHIISQLDLEKLNCEVLESNPAVVRMHAKFLFKEEGFRRSNVVKGGDRISVHVLGLTREDWIEGRGSVQERIQEVLDRFAITLEPGE